MGLFSGGNSASTSLNTTNNVKKDLVVGNESSGVYADAGSTVTTYSLDGGAIGGAFDLIKAQQVQNGADYRALLSTSQTGLAGILSGVASTQNFIAETQATSKGALDSRTITIMGAIAAGLLGLFIIRGKR